MQKKNACWVFEIVRIILIIISLICFTEKVYGSSPYSPINPIKSNSNYKNCSFPYSSLLFLTRRFFHQKKKKEFLEAHPQGSFRVEKKTEKTLFQWK